MVSAVLHVLAFLAVAGIPTVIAVVVLALKRRRTARRLAEWDDC